jgi:hypothetical protein
MRKGNCVKRLAVGFLGVAMCALGAIDGTVLNKSTGKPQPGVSVTLVKPGQQGMRTLGTTTTDAAGHFVFPDDEPGGGPQLLQANYAGVNYNKLMTPNIPTSGVEVDVYEATKSPAVAHIAERMLVFEATTSRIGVTETVVVQNSSTTTFKNDETGGLRFYLPPAANGQVRINAQGPQGMPLPRTAEKTSQSNIFKIDFPVKPGETQFQITYVLPAGSPFTFRGEVVNIKGMISGPLRLVAPTGVTLSGKDVQPLGVEPNTQATIYNVLPQAAFTVDIAGTGSLNAAGDDATPKSEDESPPITDGQPKIYEHLGWLLGFALGILGIGLIALYRSSPVRT